MIGILQQMASATSSVYGFNYRSPFLIYSMRRRSSAHATKSTRYPIAALTQTSHLLEALFVARLRLFAAFEHENIQAGNEEAYQDPHANHCGALKQQAHQHFLKYQE